MPRGCGQLGEGLASNRLHQRPRFRRLGHELRAPIMPTTEQFLPGDIDASHVAQVNDQRSIADYRRSSSPGVLQFASFFVR